jgi:IPT/TIG domain
LRSLSPFDSSVEPARKYGVWQWFGKRPIRAGFGRGEITYTWDGYLQRDCAAALTGLLSCVEGIEMGISALSIPLFVALALPADLLCQAAMPTMSTVEPQSGRVGDVLVVQGTNLGQDDVAALYLTDGKTDIKVTILEQTATSIRFRIPPEAKPGRLALMVLTKDKSPRLIEEPVKITVEPETMSSGISSSGDEAILKCSAGRL